MQLNYKKIGTGKPFIILHGLFGSLDNWQTFGRQLSEHFEVYLVDARNHGQSPHSSEWDYEVMAQDIYNFINEHRIEKPVILGHSMGGKTAMHFAVEHPGVIEKLIVADMAPKQYEPHHTRIIEGLSSLDFEKIESRSEAEAQLSKYISDFATRQFLLKNLYWIEKDKLAWRFNLKVIREKIGNIGINSIPGKKSDVPALFIRGEKSDYITKEDESIIKKHFPRAEVTTIANAGHWVHAEAPEDFFNTVLEFVKPS